MSGRLDTAAWRARAASDDLRSLAEGDPLGPLTARLRGLASAPTERVRPLVIRLVVAIVVAQGVVAALSGAGRTVRAVVSGVASMVMVVLVALLAMILLGRWVRVSTRTFRRIATVSALLLCFIVVTGASVRLTGSGLGCPDWPTCKQGRIVPAADTHALIEFGNRVITGLCVLAAAIGTLTALVRIPYRRDLVHLGLWVSAGIFGNAVLGGLSVLVGLRPEFIAGHYLLSAAVIALAVVLFHRAGDPGGSGRISGRDRLPSVDHRTVLLVRILTVGALGVLVLGTVVTGSGPHGGSEDVPRFGVTTLAAARVHSLAVWATLATVLAIALRVRRGSTPAASELRRRVTAVLGIVLVQGAIGYVQYFNRFPAGLVLVHVTGSVVFWVAVLWVREATWCPSPAATGVPATSEGLAAEPAPDLAADPAGDLAGDGIPAAG